MRFMMFGKQNLAFISKLFFNDFRDMKLFAKPERHRLQPGAQPPRSNRKIAHQQALKRHERFIVIDNMIDIADLYILRFQTVVYGLFWKPRVVFFP